MYSNFRSKISCLLAWLPPKFCLDQLPPEGDAQASSQLLSPPLVVNYRGKKNSNALRRSRTGDLVITSDALYQLSYQGWAIGWFEIVPRSSFSFFQNEKWACHLKFGM